ncbi:MAG: hypothetical protein A2216_00630 [Omnitrophica WOR_2 bacterium RIFOXYA2_FULL_45_12]|nr:MAG: hypothetical protein A2216_00630 [Omnitrophica WOR_2 bacterium RIFOXYA2_FULL_45_12]
MKEGSQMKKISCFILALIAAVCFTQFSYAAEHGGKEHGGTSTEKEHGGVEPKGSQGAQPTAQNIRQTMKDYVLEKSKKTGTFDVHDPETGKTRKLSLVRVHERVGKTGEYYYSCADFTDTETGKLLDLDLDVEHKNGKLSVVDVRIHKVNGKERYTYDENDNRIPIMEEKKGSGMMEEKKGSGN